MINERIKNDIKQAMIDKDEVKKNTLKMVINKANAQAKDIALKNKTEIELTDEIMMFSNHPTIKCSILIITFLIIPSQLKLVHLQTNV